MKFYQVMAPVMLSIICTAPIFGMEETNLPHIPPEICAIIDEFSGGEQKRDAQRKFFYPKNSFYKETAHIIERLPDLLNKQNLLTQCL